MILQSASCVLYRLELDSQVSRKSQNPVLTKQKGLIWAAPRVRFHSVDSVGDQGAAGEDSGRHFSPDRLL